MPQNLRELTPKVGTLPFGFSGGPQGLISSLETLMRIPLDGNATFALGDTFPQSNVGPFFLNGQILYVWDDDSGAYIPQRFAPKSIPVDAIEDGIWLPGDLKLSASGADVDGWLKCDGAVYGTDDYPALFNAIGFAFGGNNSTTFAVPDLRGRVPMGDGVGEDDNGDPLTARSIGNKLGEERHQLTIPELPVHDHQTRHTAGGNPFSCLIGLSGQAGTGDRRFPTGGDRTEVILCMTQEAGGDVPHNNIQPSAVVRYLIKT